LKKKLPFQLPEDNKAPLPTLCFFGHARQEALLKLFFDNLTPGMIYSIHLHWGNIASLSPTNKIGQVAGCKPAPNMLSLAELV
jgi:hypothetical protein